MSDSGSSVISMMSGNQKEALELRVAVSKQWTVLTTQLSLHTKLPLFIVFTCAKPLRAMIGRLLTSHCSGRAFHWSRLACCLHLLGLVNSSQPFSCLSIWCALLFSLPFFCLLLVPYCPLFVVSDWFLL